MPGTTKFDDEFERFIDDRKRVRCFACQLPPEIKEWVDTKLRAGAPTQAIAEFVSSKGHSIGSSAMANHRRNHVTG